MGPLDVPVLNNIQQKKQKQVMQATVEQQQLHQTAQFHGLQMLEQEFHEQMQHHQEPTLSRAGSSRSASSSGISSLESCNATHCPIDSAHRNKDAGRKTYAAAASQSVAPPTSGMFYFFI